MLREIFDGVVDLLLYVHPQSEVEVELAAASDQVGPGRDHPDVYREARRDA